MAEKHGATQFVAAGIYKRVFKSGKVGFFGKIIDPNTGKKYQVTAAVEIGS